MLLFIIIFTNVYLKNSAKHFPNITSYFSLIIPSGYLAWFDEVILAKRQWSSFFKY